MKVRLIFPRFRYTPGDPPLGISIVASYLRSKMDVDVSVIDTTFIQSFDYVSRHLEKERPEIVGIYFDTLMTKDGIKIAEMAKRAGSFVVAGGPHATILPETLLDKVDMAVIGEGELTFTEIVENFDKDMKSAKIKGTCFKENGEIVHNEPRPPIKNLDDVEFPALDLLDMKSYMENWHLLDSVNTNIKGTNVIGSRGCPFNCTFCQPTLREMFGNVVRYRSPGNVVEEIKKIKKEYNNIGGIFFHDDTLTANRKWIYDFCNILENNNMNLLWGCNTRANTIDEEMMKVMKKAGMRVLHIGAESGSQRVLDEIYQKRIKTENVSNVVKIAKDNGIHTMCFFMIGGPTETENEIKETIKFACSLDADEITATITTPLPKTHLHNMMKDKYKISEDYSKFDYYSNKVFEGEIEYNKLKKYQKEMLFKFYTSPKRWPYIYKHIKSITGWKKMMAKIRRFN